MATYGQNINIALMANTLQFKQANAIERIFDIKGSKVKRDVEITPQTKKTTVLKDVNLLRLIDLSPTLLNFLKGDIRKLNYLIKRDVLWLKEQGIMDFSLLLAIEKLGPKSLGVNSSFCFDSQSVSDLQLKNGSIVSDRETWNKYLSQEDS